MVDHKILKWDSIIGANIYEPDETRYSDIESLSFCANTGHSLSLSAITW